MCSVACLYAVHVTRSFVFSCSLILSAETVWQKAAGNSLPGASSLPHQEMKSLNMYYVEQNAGDIMWVPPGIFHAVRNMTNTVALGYNILLPSSFLSRSSPGLADLKFPGKCHKGACAFSSCICMYMLH